MNLLTLHMIVRNEEALLGDCLKSIIDWVDEAVIVDTGSSDGTIDIARSFGAQVQHFDWIDDFGAARAFALSHVKTPWTIWLDADDIILNPQIIAPACEYARRHRIAGLWCKYKQDEASYQRRLSIFKPNDFRWKGYVHESPVPRKPAATQTMYAEIDILHRKPVQRRPEAALRYLEILESKDPENWFGIAESYRFLAVYPDDPANVALYRRNAEELFHRAAFHPGADSATQFIALFYAAKLGLEIATEDQNPSRLEGAATLLQICHRLEPQRAEPVTLLGMVYEAMQDYEAARKCYEAAMKLPMWEGVGLVLQDYYRAIPKARLEKLNEAKV